MFSQLLLIFITLTFAVYSRALTPTAFVQSQQNKTLFSTFPSHHLILYPPSFTSILILALVMLFAAAYSFFALLPAFLPLNFPADPTIPNPAYQARHPPTLPIPPLPPLSHALSTIFVDTESFFAQAAPSDIASLLYLSAPLALAVPSPAYIARRRSASVTRVKPCHAPDARA